MIKKINRNNLYIYLYILLLFFFFHIIVIEFIYSIINSYLL